MEDWQIARLKVAKIDKNNSIWGALNLCEFDDTTQPCPEELSCHPANCARQELCAWGYQLKASLLRGKGRGQQA